MSLVPGLSQTLRHPEPEAPEPFGDGEVVIEQADDGDEKRVTDDSGNLMQIEFPDGSITLTLDGSPLEKADAGPIGWFDNLIDKIDASELSRIAEDLLRGVRDDIQSRREWVDDRANGVRLLGLKIDIPGIGGSADGAPVEGQSRVRHPLLLEAVLRFQANARAELLPTDGPCKIRNDDNNADLTEDVLANALERDMNHYLTTTATEYYPDTDRMLLMLGFGGMAFKKVYMCPLRNRPVSETVDADDLIVNNSATDLKNARRVTHRTMMKPSTVKRLQILGVYRDIDLGTPLAPNQDGLQQEKKSQEGVSDQSLNPEDRDREIYEIYCELDIKGFQHKWKGKVTGLGIPYRVTIDVSSREILSIVRNYDEDDEELPEAREVFVPYLFVPGFGFYGIGLLHILGNTTNALTAAWREMLDAGMFANFPGFLMADTGGRQNTNIFRVPPGGGALVKTGGAPINQAIMPLPYKDVGAGFMQMTDNMAQSGMRIGGTSEMQVGEGRADAPVGTTLAMIEQATKVLNSVHKRMHAAQAQELQLLVQCFRENPKAFWQRNKKQARPWDEKTFLEALDNCDLVPQADPNTASHAQRMMKIMGLKQLQQQSPNLYDPIAVDLAALQAMGWSNPQQFMAPPQALGKEPPEITKGKAELAIKKQDADARTMLAHAKVAEVQQGLAGGQNAAPDPVKMAELDINRAEIAQRQQDSTLDAINRKRDRESRERIEAVKLAVEMAENPQGIPIIQSVLPGDMIQRLESNEPGLNPGAGGGQ